MQPRDGRAGHKPGKIREMAAMREVIRGYAPAVMQPRRCARRSQARKNAEGGFSDGRMCT